MIKADQHSYEWQDVEEICEKIFFDYEFELPLAKKVWGLYKHPAADFAEVQQRLMKIALFVAEVKRAAGFYADSMLEDCEEYLSEILPLAREREWYLKATDHDQVRTFKGPGALARYLNIDIPGDQITQLCIYESIDSLRL